MAESNGLEQGGHSPLQTPFSQTNQFNCSGDDTPVVRPQVARLSPCVPGLGVHPPTSIASGFLTTSLSSRQDGPAVSTSPGYWGGFFDPNNALPAWTGPSPNPAGQMGRPGFQGPYHFENILGGGQQSVSAPEYRNWPVPGSARSASASGTGAAAAEPDSGKQGEVDSPSKQQKDGDASKKRPLLDAKAAGVESRKRSKNKEQPDEKPDGRYNWGNKDTKLLIFLILNIELEALGEDDDGNKSRPDLKVRKIKWRLVAAGMQWKGYEVAATQCKSRFANINKKYMAIMKLMNNRTGGANLEIPDNIDDMPNVSDEVKRAIKDFDFFREMHMFYQGNRSVVAPELEFAAGEAASFLEQLRRIKSSGSRLVGDDNLEEGSDDDTSDCEEIDPQKVAKDAADATLRARKSGKCGDAGRNKLRPGGGRPTKPYQEMAAGMKAFHQRIVRKEERDEFDREERKKREDERKNREEELFKLRSRKLDMQEERMSAERDRWEREATLREKEADNEKLRLENEKLHLQLSLQESKKMNTILGRGMSLLAKKFGLFDDEDE